MRTGYGRERGDKILRMTHGPALSSPLGLVLLLALDLPLLVLEVKDGSSLHTEIRRRGARKWMETGTWREDGWRLIDEKMGGYKYNIQ